MLYKSYLKGLFVHIKTEKVFKFYINFTKIFFWLKQMHLIKTIKNFSIFKRYF